MRTVNLVLLLVIACLGHAEIPEVIEHNLLSNGSPMAFHKVFARTTPSFVAASWQSNLISARFTPAAMNRFQPNGWTAGASREFPVGTQLVAVRYNVDLILAMFTIPDGVGTRIVIYQGMPEGLYHLPYVSLDVTGGRLRQATEASDRWGNAAPCWLVDSPTGDFVQIYRALDAQLLRLPVEKSKAIHNFFIDKVRTAYVTTIAYDGTVNHRQLFSSGQTRWHLAFPSETKVKVDPDGNTYTLRSTPSGIVATRYDYNGNLAPSHWA